MLKDFSGQKFDIIVQAGQSNAEGCGFGAVAEPFQPDEKIWYLNHGKYMNNENCWNRDLSLP